MSQNFTAVWRPGTGAQHWVSHVSAEDLKAADDTYFDQGLRLRVLRHAGDGAYLAVWQPGSGGQHWQAGISHDDFHKLDKGMYKDGYRITSLDYSGDTICVVYQHGTGDQHVHGAITYAQFKKLNKDYLKQGLRLVTMARGYNETWDEFMGVWRPGTGGQYWYSNVGSAWDDFETTDKAYMKEGYRLIAMPGYGLNGIWRPGSGRQVVDYVVDKATFKEDDKNHYAEGLRLVDLSVGASI